MSYEQFSTPLSQEDDRRPIVRSEHLPKELVSYPQWVCWRYVDRGEGRKPDKQPVNPHTLGNAGVHWKNTWSRFDEALAVYREHHLPGIGFVLTPNDPFVGVDLDGCVGKDGIGEAAQGVMQRLESYTEVSPSGKGLRILVACPNYQENRRTSGLEIYSHSRFLTVTGHHVEGTPATITVLEPHTISALIPKPVTPWVEAVLATSNRPSMTVDDTALWEQIFTHDRYGDQHLRRFHGDLSLDGNDHSLAVIRLLNCLARWTQGDAGKMRALMLQSPLVNEKWFGKRGKVDWLDYQIANAIAYVQRK